MDRGGRAYGARCPPVECAQTVSITATIHAQKGFVRGEIRKRVHGLRGVARGGMQMRRSPGIYSARRRVRTHTHARPHTLNTHVRARMHTHHRPMACTLRGVFVIVMLAKISHSRFALVKSPTGIPHGELICATLLKLKRTCTRTHPRVHTLVCTYARVRARAFLRGAPSTCLRFTCAR